MERTLYLKESRGLTVKRDGPSLWILEPGKAGRRVPARLVSRVVVIGNVLLDTEALTLFTACGVPITFMDHGGKILGTALAYDIAPDDLRERQHALSDDAEMASEIENWMEAVRRKGRLDMLRLLAPNLARDFENLGFRESDYNTIIRTFYPKPAARVKAVAGLLSGLLHESALNRISGLALDPHAGFLHRQENFGLCRDFVYMLGAELDWQAIRFFQSKQDAGDLFQCRGTSAVLSGKGSHLVIQRFEDRRVHVEEMMEPLFDGYYRFVRGIEPASVF